MKIPKVKTWVITITDGQKFEILAPTRRLALLNFRHEIGWFAIKSIGRPRTNGSYSGHRHHRGALESLHEEV